MGGTLVYQGRLTWLHLGRPSTTLFLNFSGLSGITNSGTESSVTAGGPLCLLTNRHEMSGFSLDPLWAAGPGLEWTGMGWIDLASARHSMGLSRVTSALFDLKSHSAATTLHVSQQDADAMVEQPHFVLYKWSSSDSGKCFSGEIEIDKQEMQQSSSSELRHRGSSLHSELQEEYSARSTPSPKVEDQVQKERFKSLSVFGTLVSPKLRAAQLSFETALETLIKIANMRSAMLSAFAQVQKHIEATTK
ncbi:PREDICTED: uncharacterized protein LOC104607252 isoform X2 [Nelumbo nucifera]|uniref:Vacuolar ATPase assembly protein VMA22 n=1 Tax=Nelumbo nucifera TaxID=4432 RepID=A0A1U8QA61_NELNU|nr:PREDICTED: uncharacterized protein LOC104607252 isoform X2 [Nelumbo nucifera]